MKYVVIDDGCTGFVEIYWDHGYINSDDLFVSTNIDDFKEYIDDFDDFERGDESEREPIKIDGIKIDGILLEGKIDDRFTIAKFICDGEVVAQFKIIHEDSSYKHISIYMLDEEK